MLPATLASVDALTIVTPAPGLAWASRCGYSFDYARELELLARLFFSCSGSTPLTRGWASVTASAATWGDRR